MGNLDIFEGSDVVHTEGENFHLKCLHQDLLLQEIESGQKVYLVKKAQNRYIC